MTLEIRPFDTVRIPAGIPERSVPAGCLATILDVYTAPIPGYEIEVVDTSGRTLFVGGVEASQVELVESHGIEDG